MNCGFAADPVDSGHAFGGCGGQAGRLGSLAEILNSPLSSTTDLMRAPRFLSRACLKD